MFEFWLTVTKLFGLFRRDYSKPAPWWWPEARVKINGIYGGDMFMGDAVDYAEEVGGEVVPPHGIREVPPRGKHEL